MTVESIGAGPKKISRTAEVQASAAQLFALVADPHRHGELDGSGTVKDTVSGPQQLTQDAKFSVKMKQFGLPYRITSRVTELAQDSVVEWRHPAGHRWRWEFTPNTDGSTRVTETWDATRVNPAILGFFKAAGMPKKNGAGIESTLRNLQARYAK